MLLGIVIVPEISAQSGNGSLRGKIVDEQGAAMPGATVTASSPQALTPVVAVTDGTGEYRLANLPPGTYTLKVELAGFSIVIREGILLRASANFQVDELTMKLGSLEESITVSGKSPMVEVTNPTTTMNIDAAFQEALPLTEGGFWTDFLQMTPGVLSRPHNDGSGRQNYYASGVEHREHVTQMDGFMAANYWDMNVNRTGLSGEAISDTNVKLSGVDAAAPMGYGLVINMISKSGGNSLSGSAGYTLQPFSWNGNNAAENRQEGVVGTPGTRKVDQFDVSLGGPIKKRQDLDLRRLSPGVHRFHGGPLARRHSSLPGVRPRSRRQFPGEPAALTSAVRQGDLAGRRESRARGRLPVPTGCGSNRSARTRPIARR